jgi:hypothetical protein|tara:strand:- start:951 stop:1814 length:864 start_codon:yes stop_codon:yes gene_type:complete
MNKILCLLLLLLVVYIYYKYSINEYFDNNLFKWNDAKINNQSKLINTFKNYGCIIIPNILSNDDCDKLLEIISNEERKKNNETGEINSNLHRQDLMLPLSKTKTFIKQIYDKIQKFCNVLVPNAKIVENSSLISYPGCYPQIWHMDTRYRSEKDADLISFGIALDDISNNMGPLEVFLESNKIYKNRVDLEIKHKIKDDDLNGEYDDGTKYQSASELCKILNLQKVKCSCSKGSLVIWSSKVMHRGGANTEKDRPVYYFSLMGEGDAPYGATYSLKSKDKIEFVKNL